MSETTRERAIIAEWREERDSWVAKSNRYESRALAAEAHLAAAADVWPQMLHQYLSDRGFDPDAGYAASRWLEESARAALAGEVNPE